MRTRVGIAVAAIVAVAAAAWFLQPSGGERAIRQALLEELTTVSLKNCAFERYGSAHDGGYLLCGNLIPGVESAYSYGIGTEDNWGCQVSRQFDVPVHQYDCFTPHRPVCDGGRAVFYNQCVGGRAETIDGRRFDTIAAQVAANGDTGKRLLMKIDVEGAEWDALLATPDEVLDRIDQMAMELHGTDEARFVEVLRRLKRTFHLVNLNFNNWSCTPDAAPLPAVAFQVLWVNKRIGVLDPAAPSPAPRSSLNAPDNRDGPDCQLPSPGR